MHGHANTGVNLSTHTLPLYLGLSYHYKQGSSQSGKEGWTTSFSTANSIWCGPKNVLKSQCFDLKTTTHG